MRQNAVPNKKRRNSDAYKPHFIPAALKAIESGKKEQAAADVPTRSEPVRIVRLEEKRYVGIAVTVSFRDVSAIGEANRRFMERRNEIPHIVHPEQYVCLHFANDVVFTYIYCMEVERAADVPAGMIALTVPESLYAQARSSEADPYGLIRSFLEEKGLTSNPGLFAQEVFRFGEEESKYNADIRVPIKG